MFLLDLDFNVSITVWSNFPAQPLTLSFLLSFTKYPSLVTVKEQKGKGFVRWVRMRHEARRITKKITFKNH